ncbi:MAG: hypothetical protein JWM11_4082 [Planctomycetaceae bacterium]|nr:hypothetical protein [Planctomycetaceae bacterium]
MSDEYTSDGSYLAMYPMILSRKTKGGKLEVKDAEFLVSCLLACKKMRAEQAKQK